MNNELLILVTELVQRGIQFTTTPGDEDIVVTAGFCVGSLRNGEMIQHPFICSEEVVHEIRFVQGVEINEDDAIEYVWKFPHIEEEWLAPAEEK